MYLYAIHRTKQEMTAAGTAAQPLGPGFTPEQIKAAASLEVWCSAFNDPGPDFTEFRLIGKHGEVLHTGQVGGY